MSRYLSLALAVLAAGCADPTPTGAIARFGARFSEAGAGRVTVMTQNLYVGADVDAVIGALASPDPADDFPALLFAIQTLGNTDFPSRAGVIADEIARVRPHAVGFQEVSVIDINLTALGLPIVIHLDFLAILQGELAARGLHYAVAAQIQNIVAQPLPGISLVDHDALLVDAGRVTVIAAAGQNFTRNVGVVAPGVELKRGWVWADVEVAGASYKLVSLHAEADLAGASLGGLRAAQLAEVVTAVGSAEWAILMGDFNDRPGSPMYQVVTGAGFTDAWAALRPAVEGNTCCHAADLSNRVAALTQRIDYVFTRGPGERGRLFGQIDRFGEVPADRVAGPAHQVWPADHVGLVAAVRLPN